MFVHLLQFMQRQCRFGTVQLCALLLSGQAWAQTYCNVIDLYPGSTVGAVAGYYENWRTYAETYSVDMSPASWNWLGGGSCGANYSKITLAYSGVILNGVEKYQVDYYNHDYATASAPLCMAITYHDTWQISGESITGTSVACVTKLASETIISVVGPSVTKAMPAGPALNLTAVVTKNGIPLPSKPVTISLTGGGVITGLTGVGDGAGKFNFQYVPPFQFSKVDEISASCDGCTNVAKKMLQVEACEVCDKTFGNPIQPASGEKIQNEIDWTGGGEDALQVSRHYRSFGALNTGLGASWGFGYAAKLVQADAHTVVIRTGKGGKILFTPGSAPGTWLADNQKDKLITVGGVWQYIQGSDLSSWIFDTATGLVQRITQINGRSLVLTYNALSQLIQVTNAFGRSIQMSYSATGQMTGVVTPDGQAITYAYDTSGRLASVLYPDGTSKAYVYETPTLPNALTGIFDESNRRFATFVYDSNNGRATGTQHAGGVNAFNISYGGDALTTGQIYPGAATGSNMPVSVTVSDPSGNQQALVYNGGNGTARLQSQSSPYDGASSIAERTFQFGTSRVRSERDFLNNYTENLWDDVRPVILSTTRANYKPEATTVSYQWHPTLDIKTATAEPGKLTWFVYNGQPDPFNSNIPARCAPPAAVLADGSPIAVVCKKVEQATNDANGSLGFSATLQDAVPIRTWTWSYNANGQVVTAADPLNRTSTYNYYIDTTGTHAVGDLQSFSNPAGHTTQYNQYDGAGRLLQSIDPNGVSSTYVYDNRQRLSSVNVGGQLTNFAYTSTGQISRVTRPDASYVNYTYDAAQRLTGISDSSGNSISYTLDNAGNRTAEQVRDPAGALKRQVSRVYDQLGRQQQLTGLE